MWLQQSDQYCRSVCAICSATLVRERLRRRFPPRDLLEVETVWDHCRVRLRDGRLLLARWKRTAACAWTRSTGCAEMSRAQMEQISRAYYAVIVADVRYDKTLKPNAKLLYAELYQTGDKKKCTECGAFFASTSNSVKYCPVCRKRITRRQAAERMRKRRAPVTQ